MKKEISSWVPAAGVAIVFSGMLAPADAQEPFYKGKTIRLIVGLSAGAPVMTFIPALSWWRS